MMIHRDEADMRQKHPGFDVEVDSTGPCALKAKPAMRMEARDRVDGSPHALGRRVITQGHVISLAEMSTRANVVRRSGRTSTGPRIKIGVISDSFASNVASANQDRLTGDIPTDVQVLTEGAAGSTDEGRAMIQVLRDIAPGASFLFTAAPVNGTGSRIGELNAIDQMGDSIQAGRGRCPDHRQRLV